MWQKKYIDAGYSMSVHTEEYESFTRRQDVETTTFFTKKAGDFFIEITVYENYFGGKTLVRVYGVRKVALALDPSHPNLKHASTPDINFYASGTPLEVIEQKAKEIFERVKDIQIPHL